MKYCASELHLSACGSVHGSAESAYGLPVECVGVFVIFEVLLCCLTLNIATVSMQAELKMD